MFDHSKNDENSVNMCNSQQLKFTNTYFDDMDLIKQNNELQIDLKQTKSQGYIIIIHTTYTCKINYLLPSNIYIFRFKFRIVEFYARDHG